MNCTENNFILLSLLGLSLCVNIYCCYRRRKKPQKHKKKKKKKIYHYKDEIIWQIG